MGTQRNGARTFLRVLWHACRLSKMPGFNVGLVKILGNEQATALLAAWDVACAIIEYLVANDNWFDQLDTVEDDGTGEDTPLA